jgi:hypothetical protein
MAQFSAVDATVAPNLTDEMYGELHEDDDGSIRTQTITTGGTYQGWKDATAGNLSGLTADTSDATADHLTVPAGGAGDYLVSVAATWSPVTAATQTLKFQVYAGGSPVAKTISRARLNATTNVLTTSGTWIIALSDADELALYYTSTTNGDQFQVTSLTLTAVRIS